MNVKLKLEYVGKNEPVSPDWSFPSHMHQNWSELVLVTDGEGVVLIHDERYVVHKGDLLIYHQGILHEEYSARHNPIKTFYCGISHKGSESLLPRSVHPVIKTKENYEILYSYFQLLYEENRLMLEQHQQVTEHLLKSLLIWTERLMTLHAAKQHANGDKDSFALHLKEYLDLNYLRHVSLQDIANHFRVNPYYISHAFKQKYGDSPINYMIKRRMGEAKQMLITTNLKVYEIAEILGYDNPNYFTILFTKLMKETPTQFKKREKSQRIDL